MAKQDAKLMLALVREKVSVLKLRAEADEKNPKYDPPLPEAYYDGYKDALTSVGVALCDIERDMGW